MGVPTPARMRCMLEGVCFLLLFLAGTPRLAAQNQSVRIQIIDVGQADAILIRTPNVKWALIDAGSDSWFGDSLASSFGVDQLSLAVTSHRHKDHIGGMAGVLRRIPTKRLLGDTAHYSGNTDDDNLRAALGSTTLVPLKADTITIDGVRFITLPRPPANPNENNNSIMIRLEYGAFSMLFTGDAEAAERDWLVANHPRLLDVDVLKASHHGSRNGYSTAWLQATSPQRVVISAGVNTHYKHPHPEAVVAYAAIAGGLLSCTNRHGTIRIYGFKDGGFTHFRQRITTKSCTYDGTAY